MSAPRTLPHLCRDQRGAVALTCLLCLPLIVLMLVGALDFIRYSMAQGKLQNALDSTVISAGRRLDTHTPTPGSDAETSWKDDARSYFASNMPKGYLGSDIATDDLMITYLPASADDSAERIRMRADGNLPLLVSGLMRRSAFRLAASNQAERRTRSDLEMVLALDLTGSMEGTKFDTLKTESKNLVSTLLDSARNADNLERTFIGIVPFADTVYVGPQRSHWLTEQAQAYPYIQAGDIWGGCVVEPYASGRFNAEPGEPPGLFEPLMTVGTLSSANGLVGTEQLKQRYANDRGLGYNQVVSEFQVLDSPAPSISGKRAIRVDLDGSGNLVPQFAFNPDWLYLSATGTRYRFCQAARAMTFLDNARDGLNAKIDALRIDGGTIIPLGLLWGWRMLDPAWRGSDGWGDEAKPRDAEAGLNKIIVLLTDGNNGLDPNWDNGSRYDNGVAIDGERNITGSYTLGYSYRARICNRQGQSCSTETGTRSDTLSLPASGLNDDNHYFNCGAYCMYASRSDFNSLRVGSKAELQNSDTRLSPYGQLYAGNSGGQEDWQYGNPTLNELTDELCANIKAQGIILYTVVLGSGVNDQTKDLMQGCSSGAQAGYYYDASNVGNLAAAFASIANSLTELRITE
ncbi:pilus assembly protein [Stutzerimonas kirkiae]|uniref:Putative Flp pilus-assembly TadG-like N-terminal domain-containing protein n=1 Tax=Stutzerimonas kirkiae TaxID=2211392 RepID=A0A4Q9R2J5_9GAMM|nr:pilus assembly protein TadG-related protein [Stutzerimonas kirkiae]TBU93523.1 hypothetical protein DNJ96_13875 [Stutzerimonas kirkiae]TBV01729.1 hypothetical protein DNJ95_11395 [Stutzerimonas kirkiae]TBV07427.1 hypothetical protein DNK08_12885 [Stutzerimonas kirkiae]TBV11060.1 hypothetical protein DNK01_16895 [Stutzerimonas kirkiae]